MNARTSVLDPANPVGSRYNPDLPITRNIDLPPTLISRFDLLYLILDTINQAISRRLAELSVGLYPEDTPLTAGRAVILIEKLSSYITYVRRKVSLTNTEAAGDELVP